jgi:hypothetical protein
MSVVSIDAKISLSTKEARTNIFNFYKALNTAGVTYKTYDLDPSATLELPLADGESRVCVLVCEDEGINVQVYTMDGSVEQGPLPVTDVMLLILSGLNLSRVIITNTSSEVRMVNAVY